MFVVVFMTLTWCRRSAQVDDISNTLRPNFPQSCVPSNGPVGGRDTTYICQHHHQHNVIANPCPSLFLLGSSTDTHKIQIADFCSLRLSSSSSSAPNERSTLRSSIYFFDSATATNYLRYPPVVNHIPTSLPSALLVTLSYL